MERVLLLLICFLLLSQPINCSSSLSFNSSTPLCHSHQSSALLHFRNSFSVSDLYFCYDYPPKNWWKMGTNCCGWDGVTCDTMTGHVIAVDLSCSGLQGPIHPNTTLFSLRNLQRLNLAHNDFNDSTISSKFGGFANMTHLNFSESFVAGARDIGKISCEFIQKCLAYLNGTGQPDPTIAPDFLIETRMRCQDSNRTTTQPSSPMESLEMSESAVGMSYLQELSPLISSGAGFDTHDCQSLLKGRGLLFADQKLIANEKTVRLVRVYASDDGSTSRMDFAWAMMKMSGLNVLTGSQGQVQRNCSLALVSS